MASNLVKNNLVVGITAGIVASVIGPILIPALKRSARPVAKSLVKGGMSLYQKGREAAAHAGEMMEDVMAEIHAEEIARNATLFGKADMEMAQANESGDGSAEISGARGNENAGRVYHQSGMPS